MSDSDSSEEADIPLTERFRRQNMKQKEDRNIPEVIEVDSSSDEEVSLAERRARVQRLNHIPHVAPSANAVAQLTFGHKKSLVSVLRNMINFTRDDYVVSAISARSAQAVKRVPDVSCLTMHLGELLVIQSPNTGPQRRKEWYFAVAQQFDPEGTVYTYYLSYTSSCPISVTRMNTLAYCRLA